MALLFVTCSSRVTENSNKALSCTLPPSQFLDGNYSAHKAYQAPTIDGNPVENSWAFATWASLIYDREGKLSNRSIRYKLTWNEAAIFLLIQLDSSDGTSDLELLVGGQTFNLEVAKSRATRKGNTIECEIPYQGLKNEITLPIQFALLREHKKYSSRQGYLKLVL